MNKWMSELFGIPYHDRTNNKIYTTWNKTRISFFKKPLYKDLEGYEGPNFKILQGYIALTLRNSAVEIERNLIL